MVVLFAEDFWSYVVGCSKTLVHCFFLLEDFGCPKIDNLNRRVIILRFVKDILRFEIPVYNILAMAVANPLKDLLYHSYCVDFAKTVLFNYAIK
jgi:hypothetical protein